MAKFREGNLVLTATQEIIQGASTILDANGILTLASGASINEFSTDTALGASDTKVPTQNAVKSYVDTNITSQDLDFIGDAGGAQTIDLDTQSLTLEGGTGIATTGSAQKMSFAIDSTVTTLTGIQTLTNKTLTSPIINNILAKTGETGIAIAADGATTLYYDNSPKLATSADGATITGSLTITEDLFVDGTTWVVNNQEVTTSDNIIVVNNGEVGPGVTAGSAGIEVDRGSATNYQFLFVEASDTFRIGEIGSLQAVATREDSPTDQRFPLWNDSSKRFDTATSTILRIATGIQSTVAAFDIKTSGGEDGITVNNDGAVELFYDNVVVSATTANGITGAVWG